MLACFSEDCRPCRAGFRLRATALTKASKTQVVSAASRRRALGGSRGDGPVDSSAAARGLPKRASGSERSVLSERQRLRGR